MKQHFCITAISLCFSFFPFVSVRSKLRLCHSSCGFPLMFSIISDSRSGLSAFICTKKTWQRSHKHCQCCISLRAASHTAAGPRGASTAFRPIQSQMGGCSPESSPRPPQHGRHQRASCPSSLQVCGGVVALSPASR